MFIIVCKQDSIRHLNHFLNVKTKEFFNSHAIFCETEHFFEIGLGHKFF